MSAGAASSTSDAARAARSTRGERLRIIGHLLTAAVLALKGYAKLEHPEGHGFIVGLCFGSAAIVAVATALHSRLHSHAARVEALIYLLEAAVAGTMAVVTAEEGKHGLPFAWAAAAAGLVVAGVMRWRRGRTT